MNDRLRRTVIFRHGDQVVWARMDSSVDAGALVYEGSALWLWKDAQAFSVPVEHAERVLEILNGKERS